MNNSTTYIKAELAHKSSMLALTQDASEIAVIASEIRALTEAMSSPNKNELNLLLPHLKKTISLSKEDLHRIVVSLPILSTLQIKSLTDLFLDEARELSRLAESVPGESDAIQILRSRAPANYWLGEYDNV